MSIMLGILKGLASLISSNLSGDDSLKLVEIPAELIHESKVCAMIHRIDKPHQLQQVSRSEGSEHSLGKTLRAQ